MSNTRQAQLIGGPEDGNFVESNQDRIKYLGITYLHLDGPDELAVKLKTKGVYAWDPDNHVWMWELNG